MFILEGYHQRGPTHPTEDTDRPYPEDQHIQQRKIQTDPTQRASIREDQHIQQRKIQTDPTQRASIREDQHIQQRKIQTDPTQRASIR